MSRESDLLFGLLALQMNFISREQLLECAAVWMGDRRRGLAELLREKGYLREKQAAAVTGMVEAQIDADGGDAGRSVVAAAVDRGVRDGLLGLKPPADVEKTISAMRPRDGAGHVVIVAPPSDGRYRLGGEIARGGLGRIVEAWDTGLEREVAVKLVLDDLPPELAERFEREAKLTGRLDHPNIVPIYDFGTLPATTSPAGGAPAGSRRLFLSMKRIRGRDLARLLKAVADGDPGTTGVYTRHRLLRIFQDVCQGIAFAHDRGVLHRDLKPANVMVGEYGETLIVDWGLARVMAQAAELPPSSATPEPRVFDQGLTLDGEVVGTPAYMPPEQATGSLAGMDQRSDVYSLGAILFEMLTLHPPVEGRTVDEIIGKVRSGRISPPSSRVGAAGAEGGDRTLVRAPSHQASPEEIPPELDAICLKALAYRKEDRYASARELHDEVQLFLEGVKERERSGREARDRVARGRAHLARYRELAGRIEAQEAAVRELSLRIKEHMPAGMKRPLWDAQEQLRLLEEERVEAFAAANAEFGQAIAVKRDCTEAMDGRCELLMDRYITAEKQRNRNEMLLNRRMLEANDPSGRYRANLDAPGRLTIRTFAYGCDCLRPVAHPEWGVEIGVDCTIPWRDGRPRPGLPLHDRDFPVPAMRTRPAGIRWGHAPDCPRREVAGTEVWIARYEERDRRLQPGELRLLGKTPLVGAELAQGSWRCTLRAAGYADVLLPVRIGRAGTWSQDVNLYRADEIPPGLCYVPGGPFTYGGEYAGGSAGEETRITEDVFVARFPVKVGEYLDYLNELAATGRIEEARKRTSREGEGRYFVETPAGFDLPPPDSPRTLVRSRDNPVFGMSWFDTLAFLAWRSKRDGLPWSLPHEDEWEKTARGVDARIYPFGNNWDGSYCHTNMSLPDGHSPLPVGSFPVDESPYGVRDMAGGVMNWQLNSLPVPYRTWRGTRGGVWCRTSARARSAMQMGEYPKAASGLHGIRPVLRPWAWPSP